MIVTQADFNKKPYIIPNQTENRDLQDYIDDKEDEYLPKILGYDLHADFISGLETSGTIEQKWLDLRDGVVYEYNDKNYKFKGVKSFLIPLIYSEWLSDNYRKWTSAGMIVGDGQNNSKTVSPKNEVVMAWNNYCDQVGSYYNQKGTMYGFIKVNEDEYEDWVFCQPLRRNTIGI